MRNRFFASCRTARFVSSGSAKLRTSLAAVFHQKGQEAAHLFERHRVPEGPSITAAVNQSCVSKLVEMERQRRRGYGEGDPDVARRHAFRTGFHQQPKDFQACFLRQTLKGIDGVIYFHDSKNIKLLMQSQAVDMRRRGTTKGASRSLHAT